MERKRIEMEAMMVVRAHLEAQGYRVRDVASRQSYDFEAHLANEVIFVEVKGTTSRPWAVELADPELVPVGNPITNTGCEVAPVRYRVFSLSRSVGS